MGEIQWLRLLGPLWLHFLYPEILPQNLPVSSILLVLFVGDFILSLTYVFTFYLRFGFLGEDLEAIGSAGISPYSRFEVRFKVFPTVVLEWKQQ